MTMTGGNLFMSQRALLVCLLTFTACQGEPPPSERALGVTGIDARRTPRLVARDLSPPLATIVPKLQKNPRDDERELLHRPPVRHPAAPSFVDPVAQTVHARAAMPDP